MTNHFPEAFKRFPEWVKNVKNFEQLKLNFKSYAKDKAPLTRKRGGQLHALAVEAKKMGILPYEQFRFKRYNKIQIRWRDVTTGRLVKHVEEG